MEDECSIGNDETRIFILSSYASNKMNRVPCVLCKNMLLIFDRYPLLDGTFFLSPKQHNKSCIQVNMSWHKKFYISYYSNLLLNYNLNLFSNSGKIGRQNKFLDRSVYGLSRGMDRGRHRLPVLSEVMDR